MGHVAKVFCFFFSKKKCLLPSGGPHIRSGYGKGWPGPTLFGYAQSIQDFGGGGEHPGALLRAGDGDLDGAVGAAFAAGQGAAVGGGDDVDGPDGRFGLKQAAQDQIGAQQGVALDGALLLGGGDVAGGLQDAVPGCFVLQVGEERAGQLDGEAGGVAEGGEDVGGHLGEGQIAA